MLAQVSDSEIRTQKVYDIVLFRKYSGTTKFHISITLHLTITTKNY